MTTPTADTPEPVTPAGPVPAPVEDRASWLDELRGMLVGRPLVRRRRPPEPRGFEPATSEPPVATRDQPARRGRPPKVPPAA